MTTTEPGLVGTKLPLDALSSVPKTDAPQKPKDYTSDQEVRWCPGCGDYVIPVSYTHLTLPTIYSV